jgi:prophage tail gpP-like protein
MRDHDEISLQLPNGKFSRFLQYSISSDLHAADSSFSFSSSRPDFSAQPGDECCLYINDVLAMTGIVDIVGNSYTKEGEYCYVTGRDIVGQCTDHYTDKWQTFTGKTIRYLAETLLADVPVVGRKPIVFEPGCEQLNVVGTLQTEPGQTVFDILRDAATSRGLVFYASPKGEFLFRKPLKNAAPKYSFTVENVGGKYVNHSHIISSDSYYNSTKHYRNIIVTGQTSDGDNFKKVFTDDTAPLDKRLVVSRNDNTLLTTFGNSLISQQRRGSFEIVYTVSGHSQNGVVFEVNTIASVKDKKINFTGDLLLYSVRKKLDKNSGILTEITLSYPGVV